MTDMSTDLVHLNQATCWTSSVTRATAYGGSVPDDTGAADPGLTAALAAYAEDPAREPEVLAALADARLLVPSSPSWGSRRSVRTAWPATSRATWRPC